MPEIDTHNIRIDFGMHEGQLYTRLPLGYLRWMILNKVNGQEIARAELERRGAPIGQQQIEVSAHAIDRASCFAWKAFRRRRQDNEGLHSWLVRETIWLLENEEIDEDNKMQLEEGLWFVLDLTLVLPVLKTVISHGRKKR